MARRVSPSVWIAAAAALVLAAAYGGIVWGASGSFDHLLEQVSSDWYLLMPLFIGFGVQLGLVAELRRRHRMQASAAAAGGAGAGASTLGMLACCAHHVADLAPLVGVAGAATFLTAYRLPFVFSGLGVTGIGIIVSARRLAATPSRSSKAEACAA